jgi:hypothetical protein
MRCLVKTKTIMSTHMALIHASVRYEVLQSQANALAISDRLYLAMPQALRRKSWTTYHAWTFVAKKSGELRSSP